MKTFAFNASVLVLLSSHCIAQVPSVNSLDKKHLNWHNHDPKADNVMGTSVDKTWDELLKNRSSKKTIIVAVIDSGVDIDHEDLKESIWVNEDEIPDNQIDDDHNGFVDDIHGWNFIGNSQGENVRYENLEFTRIYRAGSSQPDYERARKAYQAKREEQQKEKVDIENFEKRYWQAKNLIKQHTGITVNTIKDMDAISPDANQRVIDAKRFLTLRYERGFTEAMLLAWKQQNDEYLQYFLNLNFHARKIVGDNPAVLDGVYGNPDVEGPRADHGTSVAGVIAAKRNNTLGIDGIAQDVKIMCVRSTPRGDERDKDVANAIRYAVDNGAHIINMSFGKAFSPEKQLVDDAVRYAEQKNVLLVHASGNDGENIDNEPHYPTNIYANKTKATNWITVGASDAVADESLPAVFSNYGEKDVDIFAPGVNIISLDSSNTYAMHDGTSLAAPVVSGVAALILSYHPELTPPQLIDILLQSSTKMDKLKVLEPGRSGDRKKAKFKNLSRSGGILNAYEALKKADALYAN